MFDLEIQVKDPILRKAYIEAEKYSPEMCMNIRKHILDGTAVYMTVTIEE